MRGRKTALRVILTEKERNELLRLSRSTSCASGLVKRSKAVLLVADGVPLQRRFRSRMHNHESVACVVPTAMITKLVNMRPILARVLSIRSRMMRKIHSLTNEDKFMNTTT